MCEMLGEERAYTLHLQKTPSLPDNYDQTRGAVFCEVETKRCPYKQQGNIGTYTDSDSGIVHICNSDGIVPSNIKPRKRAFRKAR